MARNKPGNIPDEPAPPSEVAGGRASKGSTGLRMGENVGHAIEPGLVTEDPETGERVEIPVAPLVDPAPVSDGVSFEDPNAPGPAQPERYEILEKRNVVLHGHVVLLKVGKVVDGRSFDIARLKAEGVKLRRLE